MSKWTSVKDKIPEGRVLVIHLTPFFGKLVNEIAIGYFDDPKDHENGDGDGWLDGSTSMKIRVTHWMKIPKEPKSKFDGMDQKDFITNHDPVLGSIF